MAFIIIAYCSSENSEHLRFISSTLCPLNDDKWIKKLEDDEPALAKIALQPWFPSRRLVTVQ